MKPHEAHAKTEEPSEAQSITNTTRAARPGGGNRDLSWQRHDMQITRALSHGHSWKEATGLICIDAKP